MRLLFGGADMRVKRNSRDHNEKDVESGQSVGFDIFLYIIYTTSNPKKPVPMDRIRGFAAMVKERVANNKI